MTFVAHVVLVMVVSVVRRRRRFRATAFRRRHRRRRRSHGQIVFVSGNGVAVRNGRHASFRCGPSTIANAVATACLTRMMLVRSRSSTPTMVPACMLRRPRRRDTVVG